MATATLERPAKSKALHVTLQESVIAAPSDGPALEIDKESGVIKNVKVLGFESKNGHRTGAKRTVYTREALARAVTLYEGVIVRKNHDPRGQRHPGGDSEIERNVGILRNVRLTDDGIRADLHYKKSHPYSAELVEDVERRMGTIALSHNADGAGRVEKDTFVVTDIPEVRSVDLVSKGGTTANLWESDRSKSQEQPAMKKTLRTWLKEAWSDESRTNEQRKHIAELLEMDDMKEKPVQEQDPMPMGGVEVEASSPEEALASGFESALTACVKDFVSGKMSDSDFLSKVKEFAKMFSKATGAGESKPKEEAKTEEGDEEADKKDKEVKESLERLAAVEAELSVYRLCESKGFKPDAIDKKVLIALSESDRLPYIVKKQAEKTPIKSSSPHTFRLNESQKNEKPAAKDAESFVSAITR